MWWDLNPVPWLSIVCWLREGGTLSVEHMALHCVSPSPSCTGSSDPFTHQCVKIQTRAGGSECVT